MQSRLRRLAASRLLVFRHDVGQDPPLVDDPGQQTDRRVFEMKRHRLELGPVNPPMRRVVADVRFLLIDEEPLLLFSLWSSR